MSPNFDYADVLCAYINVCLRYTAMFKCTMTFVLENNIFAQTSPFGNLKQSQVCESVQDKKKDSFYLNLWTFYRDFLLYELSDQCLWAYCSGKDKSQINPEWLIISLLSFKLKRIDHQIEN